MHRASGPRGRGRWWAATLAAWLGMPGLAAGAEPPSTASVHARFDEGTARFQDKEYLEAAEIFTDVLGQVDEVLLNRATRENVMINVLLAYEWAYRTSTDAEGRKDVSLLDAGHEVLEAYLAELTRVYKAQGAPSQELGDVITRFEDARRIAHEKYSDQPPAEPGSDPVEPEPPIGPCLSPPPPPPIRSGCGGDTNPEVAWLGVLVLPMVRRRRGALERMASRLPADVVRRLRSRDDDD